jgi:hypothetical protein
MRGTSSATNVLTTRLSLHLCWGFADTSIMHPFSNTLFVALTLLSGAVAALPNGGSWGSSYPGLRGMKYFFSL